VVGGTVLGSTVVLGGGWLARGRLVRVLRGSGLRVRGLVRGVLLSRGCHVIGRVDGRTAASRHASGDRRDDDADYGYTAERQPDVPANDLTEAASLGGSGQGGRGHGTGGTGSQVR
jgi:hypothetical protein